MNNLSRRQREIFDFIRAHYHTFSYPPTLEQLCQALGMASRGSLSRHIQILIQAGLIESFHGNKHGGVRLTEKALQLEQPLGALPFIGVIAAGKPIEAIENRAYMQVPDVLQTEYPCYVLQVKGDSMLEAGIFDGDWVVIEQRNYASDGDIVVALINREEATLKYIQQTPTQILLIPANATLSAMSYSPEQVQIQGVLVGQMRSYRSFTRR